MGWLTGNMLSSHRQHWQQGQSKLPHLQLNRALASVHRTCWERVEKLAMTAAEAGLGTAEAVGAAGAGGMAGTVEGEGRTRAVRPGRVTASMVVTQTPLISLHQAAATCTRESHYSPAAPPLAVLGAQVLPQTSTAAAAAAAAASAVSATRLTVGGAVMWAGAARTGSCPSRPSRRGRSTSSQARTSIQGREGSDRTLQTCVQQQQ
jgi:hypothetical protein